MTLKEAKVKLSESGASVTELTNQLNSKPTKIVFNSITPSTIADALLTEIKAKVLPSARMVINSNKTTLYLPAKYNTEQLATVMAKYSVTGLIK